MKKSLREKQKSVRETKKVPVKVKKFQKSVRESKNVCVKNVEKVCVKAIFCAWKNSKKGQKNVSRTLFFFTYKKKHCVLVPKGVLIKELYRGV